MVVEKVLLTSSWEVPPNQWGSRAATVAAHQPVEHCRNFLQKLFHDPDVSPCTILPNQYVAESETQFNPSEPTSEVMWNLNVSLTMLLLKLLELCSLDGVDPTASATAAAGPPCLRGVRASRTNPRRTCSDRPSEQVKGGRGEPLCISLSLGR